LTLSTWSGRSDSTLSIKVARSDAQHLAGQIRRSAPRSSWPDRTSPRRWADPMLLIFRGTKTGVPDPTRSRNAISADSAPNWKRFQLSTVDSCGDSSRSQRSHSHTRPAGRVTAHRSDAQHLAGQIRRSAPRSNWPDRTSPRRWADPMLLICGDSSRSQRSHSHTRRRSGVTAHRSDAQHRGGQIRCSAPRWADPMLSTWSGRSDSTLSTSLVRSDAQHLDRVGQIERRHGAGQIRCF
jgi:hypothetical protein